MIEPMRNKIVSHEEYEMRSTVYDNFTGFILYSFFILLSGTFHCSFA